MDGTPVVGDLLKIMFVDNHVVPTIFDFFFRFPWNNFLHNVVYDVIQQVFNGQMEHGFNRCLAVDVFESARITERIIEGQAASDATQRDRNMRLGYMGHLTLIAEEVVKFAERNPETLSPPVLRRVTAREWGRVRGEHARGDARARQRDTWGCAAGSVVGKQAGGAQRYQCWWRAGGVGHVGPGEQRDAGAGHSGPERRGRGSDVGRR